MGTLAHETGIYCSLTTLPKRGVSALSSVAAFNHERAPKLCFQ